MDVKMRRQTACRQGGNIMIRQQAFAGEEKMLKGGLHCHTTRSDGAGSPDEVIRYHHQHGYEFLAITDHRIYNYKNYAPDVPITIIPGMEMDASFDVGQGFRCFHVVCIGPERDNGNGYEQDQRLESGKADNQEEFQPYLDDIHEKGNLTIYCHPEWSSTPARYFENLKGNFAMEIWNTGCAMENEMDRDAAYWDELLGQGKVIYGVATDDGHPMRQHCKGWVMVRAENTISSILEALKNGAFYSSCGPEIHDFYVEDGKAVIKCSPAARIRLHCDRHPTRVIRAEEGLLTCGEMDLTAWGQMDYSYIRAVVIDEKGRYAWTNPIFLSSRSGI